MRLDGRVAVITGAGSGIGAASALAMAKEGARVVVVDVTEASAKPTVEQIEKAGGQALAVRADVTRAADNQMIVEKALTGWGRLDVFFANAGVPQSPENVEDVDEALFDRIMAGDAKGGWPGAKSALSHLQKQPGAGFPSTASSA